LPGMRRNPMARREKSLMCPPWLGLVGKHVFLWLKASLGRWPITSNLAVREAPYAFDSSARRSPQGLLGALRRASHPLIQPSLRQHCEPRNLGAVSRPFGWPNSQEIDGSRPAITTPP
jgi:hypothetical protein